MATTWITGISTDEHALSWTVLHRTKEVWAVADQGCIPLPQADADAAASATAGAWKTLVKHIRGDVVATLPTRQTLLRIGLFPSTDEDELRGMAELQATKFAPIPEDQLVLGLERVTTSEGSSLLAMAATPRDALDVLGSALQENGIRQFGVDVESLGWWHLLKEHEPVPQHEACLYFFVFENHTEMVLSREGVPILFESLPGCPAESENLTEWAQDLAGEIGYLLTTAEADWGPLEHPSAVVFAEAKAIGEALLQHFAAPHGGGTSAQTKLLASLPPLSEGIARRHVAAADEAIHMDLSLPEWREADATRRLHRTLLRGTGIFLLLWLFCVSGFSLLLQTERSRISKLEAEVTRVERPATEVRRIRGKLKEWNLYADRTHSALETLREISGVMPPGMELTMFAYRKGTNVTLRGEAGDTDPIYTFIRNLEQSALFTSVSTEGGISTRNIERRGIVHTFNISVTLPSTALEDEAP